ncbi:flavin reductase family protein [uncultured Methanobrevibacter sp.]|uniref:flavin reductase family protein n=1 Tax=uncultured Methanobrevibacter sp. TaxID=253161 RepID=UPI0025F8F5F2|nr:flavin reductase family protein [uncultured Methanobrevibacter sp.]
MKVNINPKSMMFPAPAVVASAYDEQGNADCCTLAFAAMCSHHPPAVMIAINTTLKRKTLKSILNSNEFTLAFPSAEHVAEADYIGIASGYDTNKLQDVGFTFNDAEKVNAPIINEFKISLECRVMHTAEVGSHTQITGEIVNVQAEEDVLNEEGKISYEKLNPLCYDDVSHSYFEIGDFIAKAFKVGLKFRK